MKLSAICVCALVGQAAVTAGLALPALPADLSVTVTGLRNVQGDLLVAVCDESTFLSPQCAHRARVPAQQGGTTIGDLPPGIYAAQAFHDENGNGHLDCSGLGRPLEGMGFSRNVPMRFGPPRFADAAIELGAAGGSLTLTLRYFQ